MKIIFTSPFNPLWSKSVSEIASLLDAKVVSIGDLLRAETKSNSVLGKEIETTLQSGALLPPDLVSDLLSQRFFNDSASKILVNYPINAIQAESLVQYIKNSAYGLNACVVVNANKESIMEKFESQFHCTDPFHPKLETSISNPKCEICGTPMIHSYDLKNDKVAHLIDSYVGENGGLGGASTLTRLLGIGAISYTTPKEVVNQIQGLSHV
jgi:adenylate kinase